MVYRGRLGRLSAFVLCLLWSVTQAFYVERSRGSARFGPGTFEEIPLASARNLLGQLETIGADNTSRLFVSDSPEIPLMKLEGLYTKGKNVLYLSPSPLRNIRPSSHPNILGSHQNFTASLRPELRRTAAQLTDLLQASDHRSSFLLHPPDPSMVNRYQEWTPYSNPTFTSNDCTFIGVSRYLTVLNDRSVVTASPEALYSRPCSEMKDHLVLMPSELGQERYYSKKSVVALHRCEADYFQPSGRMAGIGRHVLMQVFNYTGPHRLVLDFTTSLQKDTGNRIPSVDVIGTERRPFDIAGRGAARLFSPPIAAQFINNSHMLGLEMGADGTRFPIRRAFLMRLFGTDINLDYRKIVAFARGISLISEDEYRGLNAPTTLRRFPQDLSNPDLEYSGVYEDGWLSGHAYFFLGQQSAESELTLELEAPRFGASSTPSRVELLLDGAAVLHSGLEPGSAVLRAAVPSGTGRRKVELKFSNEQMLPYPDSRPVAARLTSVSLHPRQSTAQ